MTIEEVTQLLYEAAQSRKCCRVKFTGEPLERVIHPYGVCRTGQNKIVIVCWQAMGYTGKNYSASFKNLPLPNCENVEIMAEHFRVKENFNPNDSMYKEWVFHI